MDPKSSIRRARLEFLLPAPRPRPCTRARPRYPAPARATPRREAGLRPERAGPEVQGKGGDPPKTICARAKTALGGGNRP